MHSAALPAIPSDPIGTRPPDDEEAHAEFAARIAAIHGLGPTRVEDWRTGGVTMDTRQAELRAMFDSFLGEGYDRRKVQQVARLQDSLHGLQARLLDRYEREELSAAAYVQQVNDAVRVVFGKCEQVLGSEDFERLFGGPPSEAGGTIDLDEFLRAEAGAAPR